ncbi:zinc-dependent alcohol dehydrogenase [Paenibacillus spongiae]|uniref:Galactitol-1-phosphate 5-dehydrogenase n=1 Tax=Paenibacillus spongiae TaxID=2909671 RepID=A0ABY5S4L7_9BACL|nr:galactitol-1-phosphate 5-dehydrogenase [Paenibacillus spongiae]UVI28535.1 galactitol-1-phosphate 5-dehydrogenase [Paenibacillus spongiae]
MNALVWVANETMQWEPRPDPVPLPSEVLIQVKAVGICGSEIEGYLGHNSLRIPPLVMGHEFCGEIVGMGSEVSGLRAGQKVVVNPLLFCGQCRSCMKGLTQLCEKRNIIGIHRSGAFGELVSVPAQAVVPVPDSISPFRAALSEPLACSLRATKRAMAGHSLPNVLVFGAGGIGLLCAMSARILGASKIAIVDRNPDRLAMTKRLALGEVINSAAEDIRSKALELFGGEGVDVVIDAAGFQDTRDTAVRLLNSGGTLMNIGLGIDDTSLPMNHLTRQEITILGSFCYTREDFSDAVALLVSGRVTEEGWTEIRPLSEGGNAFAELVSGRVHHGKIILDPAL